MVFWPSNMASTLSEESSPQAYHDAPAVAFDRWVHIATDFDAAGGIESCAIDGVKVSFGVRTVTPGNQPVLKLQIGINSFTTPAKETTVFIDNVVLDAE